MRKGYIKAIIGLPPNLFYGTGIPACIVVIDKQNAQVRKGIFMIDASLYFIKDGPKNRLRDQDIHKIVDAFQRREDVDKYARMVSFEEIERNEFNLNLPRYIDTQEPEDIQDIEGHLKGGIPAADIYALGKYWEVCPGLLEVLFKPNRPGYFDLAVEKSAIKSAIHEHPEFEAFVVDMATHFEEWRKRNVSLLYGLEKGFLPKELIATLSEDLLAQYNGRPLIDAYDVYQHLMDYWADSMQDDCYLIAAEGWKAETYRLIKTDKIGKGKDKGWSCDLIPKRFIVARYYAEDQAEIDKLNAELDSIVAILTEMEEEYSNEEGAFSELEKINKTSVTVQLKELQGDAEAKEETALLKKWLGLYNEQAALKKKIKKVETGLDAKAYAHYSQLNAFEIKVLVVDDKWLTALSVAIGAEVDRASQRLAHRVRELAVRYETPLPKLIKRADDLEEKVASHLNMMGYSWN